MTDELKFLRARPTLDFRFALERRGAVFGFFSIDNFYWFVRTRVVSAFAGLMLLESSFNVGGDAGVEGFVGAEEEVEGVGGFRHSKINMKL